MVFRGTQIGSLGFHPDWVLDMLRLSPGTMLLTLEPQETKSGDMASLQRKGHMLM